MIEYKIVKEANIFKDNIKAIEITINKLAKKGWRVISVAVNDGMAYATMERDSRNV